MGGPTSAGLAALLSGEGWHYVGEAGEPAFENSWTNSLSDRSAGFRIREAGVVDLSGVVHNGTPGATIYTLPAGYRPIAEVALTATGTAGASTVPCLIVVDTDGHVSAQGSTNPQTVFMQAQFFLVPATAP